MIQINNSTRYWLYHRWADVRKSFDGLSGIVENEMRMEIKTGDVFLFFNRRQTHLKALEWEGESFGMYYKRLEEGTFELPSGIMEGTHSLITAKQLMMILQGVSMQKAFYRKRYVPGMRVQESVDFS
jgi:transposase